MFKVGNVSIIFGICSFLIIQIISEFKLSNLILLLKNVSVLVTGGASSFGRATAERFGKHGASVMLCDQESSNGEQIAKEIGPNVSFMSADITNESDVINLVKEIKQKYGRLNLLVNCPSVESKKPIYDFEQKQPQQLEGFQSILKVGLFNRTSNLM